MHRSGALQPPPLGMNARCSPPSTKLSITCRLTRCVIIAAVTAAICAQQRQSLSCTSNMGVDTGTVNMARTVLRSAFRTTVEMVFTGELCKRKRVLRVRIFYMHVSKWHASDVLPTASILGY